MEEIAERISRNIAKDAKQDALRLTKFYLEGFRSQEQYVKNLKEDIEDRYTTSMTPQYGEHIGHSSVPKMELGAKLAGDKQHQQDRTDYTKAKHIAERIEKAMEGLPQPERVILEGRYINSNREPWTHIAELIGYDERYCYKLHNKGLRHIAINLFGIEDVLKAENDKRDKRSIREIGQY